MPIDNIYHTNWYHHLQLMHGLFFLFQSRLQTDLAQAISCTVGSCSLRTRNFPTQRWRKLSQTDSILVYPKNTILQLMHGLFFYFIIYHTVSEYPGIHVQLGCVFAGNLKQRRFVACDFGSLLGLLSWVQARSKKCRLKLLLLLLVVGKR